MRKTFIVAMTAALNWILHMHNNDHALGYDILREYGYTITIVKPHNKLNMNCYE